MARKYELITELYRRTAASVTAPQTWQSFLTTACRNFRLSFDEQILLFAQRPDATAVLEIERWNQKFGRWVNRGATGIAVFDGDHNGRTRLKYYFDLSDTHDSRFSRPVPVWEVQPSFAPAIMETLENSFGELADKSELGAALLSAAKNAVEDNLPDYLTELNYYKEGSFLEELDDLNIEVRFRTAVQNSVGYMLLSRCGIDPALYFSDDDFRCVLEFNTPNTLNALGAATGDIAQMCLTEISRTVLSLQKQAQKENRTVAGQPETKYPVTERTPTTTERSDEHEQDDLHREGRLPSARPAAAPGAGSDPWEVRPAAAEIPQGAPQSDLHQSADLRDAEQPPAGDRTDGPRPDGADRGADGQGRGRDGGAESQGPDDLGGPDEQPPALGGGDGAGGADLRLTTEEATEKAGSDELPAFLDEKLIGAIISNKDNDLKYNKQQIELYFSLHPDEAQRAEYLYSAYQGRYTEIMVDGVRVGYAPQEDGLLMWEGAYLSRTKESVLSWGTVAGLVAQLIEKSEYHINTDIKGLVTQEAQQLTLFDLAGMVEPEAQDGGEPPPLFPHPRLPQQVIDEALCIGANDQNSRLIICAYFMKDKPLEENARFLARHYGVNGAGFYLNDRQYAIWYDGEGIRISGGESVQRTSATLITWEEAASRVRELLDMGRYMPQREIDQAADFERSRLADSLLYLYRDIDEDFDGQFFPTLQKIYDTPKGFPDMAAEVKSLLEQPETLEELLAECVAFMRAYAHDRNILRFRYHQPEKIHGELRDLQREPLTFTAADGYDPQRRFFISTDEIDKVLRGGKDSTDYRLDIYSQYRRFPDHKELAEYIKRYHGEYSGFHGGNDNRAYTSKGPHFSHGSISEPYAKVELSWVKVASRIENLIKHDRFLSDGDRAAIPAYEQNRVARSVYHFFTGISEETPCPFPRSFPYWDAIKYLDQQLSDPAKVEEIYQLMLPIWESTAQDDRYYTRRKEGLDAFTAFRDGTFSLFGEKKEPRSQVAETQTTQAAATGTETVARYVSDDEPIVIQRYPNGQYYNRYGYDEQTGEAASTAGGFATLNEAMDAMYAHRPLAEREPQSLRAEVRDLLEELGYEVTEELLNVGLMEYASRGGRGNAEDIADYIEDELLSEETPPELIEDELEEDGPEEPHENLIGKEVTIDDRRFIVDSVDGRGQASLRDITFQRDVGFPIFRVEHIDTVRGLLRPAEKEQPAVLMPPKPRRERVVFATLHPEVPAEQRHDLRISDPRLGHGTPGEKFAANTAAIRCLKQIEAEERLATPEEQVTLSRYVGWGGLADCFDERSSHYQELKSLLDTEEYAAARASSLTAFYTSPVIIEAMYQALSQMGFRRGNILEPSCGVGNFIGMLPENMADSKLYGVELDSISGRIAQQLYQNSSISVSGFEKVQMPDSFFDVVVGNVPFGDFKVHDKRYDKNNFLIHDYFFAKSIDKLRPGGVLALITSNGISGGTFDKRTAKCGNISPSGATSSEPFGYPPPLSPKAPGLTLQRTLFFCKSWTVSAAPTWKPRIGWM